MNIVVSGNPVDGFSYWGPFDHSDDAVDFANEITEDWWIADLASP